MHFYLPLEIAPRTWKMCKKYGSSDVKDKHLITKLDKTKEVPISF